MKNLGQLVAERARAATAGGALRTIHTDREIIEQHGVSFVVRVRSDPTTTEDAGRPGHDPFLPHEEDLFVADVTQSHFCVLNKFNVIDRHLLIVTRAFEDQEQLLTQEDFVALWSCLLELGGLAFYNGGAIAGASQPHKHLQLVPLPFVPRQSGPPIEPLLAGPAPSLPFRHALARVDPEWLTSPTRAAQAGRETYHAMLQAVGLHVAPAAAGRQPGPYNLLVTRSWMLLVPRSRESFREVPVNALGFAGSLFVRNRRQLQLVRELGPMTILREVGISST